MPKRITILIDNDLMAKLRKFQAEQIKESEGSVSFSKAINETLRKSKRFYYQGRVLIGY